MSFTGLLYSNIGKRIKKQREKLNITQEKLAEYLNINTYPLISKIENGKADDGNPYLFPKNFLSDFIDYSDKKGQKISIENLIWGTDKEKECFVKMLLLVAIMNGVKKEDSNKKLFDFCSDPDKNAHIINPFFYSDDYRTLFQWAKKQGNIDRNITGYLKSALIQIEQGQDITEQYISLPHTVWTSNEKIRKELLYASNDDYPALEQKYLMSGKIEIEKNAGEPIQGKELRKLIQEHFKKENGFFFDKINYENYQLLIDQKGYEKNSKNINQKAQKRCDDENMSKYEYGYISSILLRNISTDLMFAQSFLERFCIAVWNEAQLCPNEEDKTEQKINDFLSGKDRYVMQILDFKECEYYVFTNAFNTYWKRKKEVYMEYFNRVLFDKEFLKNGRLEKFSNSYFHEILTSQEFIELNQRIEMTDTQSEERSFLSNQYQRLILQLFRLKNKKLNGDITKETESLYEYILKMYKETLHYIETLKTK